MCLDKCFYWKRWLWELLEVPQQKITSGCHRTCYASRDTRTDPWLMIALLLTCCSLKNVFHLFLKYFRDWRQHHQNSCKNPKFGITVGLKVFLKCCRKVHIMILLSFSKTIGNRISGSFLAHSLFQPWFDVNNSFQVV